MFIYVASPYSSPDREIERRRYADVMKFMTWLITENPFNPPPYSPILHCHDWADQHDLPKDARFWRCMNLGMLNKASKLFVLRLEGWGDSNGVSMEIQFVTKIVMVKNYIFSKVKLSVLKINMEKNFILLMVRH
jgi:hypothetical protein